jgi:hypothetical protein
MKGKRMAAQLNQPLTKSTRKLTDRQKVILKTKQEHPGLTVREIGAIADCTHANVIHTLKRYGINQEHLREFKSNRADILAGLQHRLLNSLTDEDIKKAPMGSRVLAAAQLFDKERLQNDLSTQNLASVHADVAAMKALQDKGKG